MLRGKCMDCGRDMLYDHSEWPICPECNEIEPEKKEPEKEDGPQDPQRSDS
jgi:hypothetical protein